MKSTINNGDSTQVLPLKKKNFLKFTLSYFLIFFLLVGFFILVKAYLVEAYLVLSPIIFLLCLIFAYLGITSLGAIKNGEIVSIGKASVVDSGSFLRLGTMGFSDIRKFQLLTWKGYDFLSLQLRRDAKVLSGWDEPKGLLIDLYSFFTKRTLFYPRSILDMETSQLQAFVDEANRRVKEERSREEGNISPSRAKFAKEPVEEKVGVAHEFKFSLKKSQQDLESQKIRKAIKAKKARAEQSLIEVNTATAFPSHLIEKEDHSTEVNSGGDGGLSDWDQQVLDLYSQIIRPLFRVSDEDLKQAFGGRVENLRKQEGEFSAELLGLTINGEEFVFKMKASSDGDVANLIIFYNDLLVYKLLLRFDLSSLEAVRVLEKLDGEWMSVLFSLEEGTHIMLET